MFCAIALHANMAYMALPTPSSSTGFSGLQPAVAPSNPAVTPSCRLLPGMQTHELQAEREAAVQEAAAFGGRGKGAFNVKSYGGLPPAKGRRGY